VVNIFDGKLDSSITFENKEIFNLRKIIGGMTSTIYLSQEGFIVKKINKITPHTRDIFKREIYWLTKLADTGIVPLVKDVDVNSCTMIMQYCGEEISKQNKPDDWQKQLQNILEVLKQHNCNHNDLSEHEILVKDKKLYVVDFGTATLGLDETCEGKFLPLGKNRIFSDKHLTNLLKLNIEDVPKNSEPHCFVLWDPDAYVEVELEIAKKFTILQAVTYSVESIKLLGSSRIEFLSRFYHGRISQHGEKALKPFTVFVVLDLNPIYEIRTNAFNGDKNVVNINTFDFLQTIRKGRTSFLHGSDNIQESFDNLETLMFYQKGVPLNYWHAWRPHFKTVNEFFNTLNNTEGLQYVVQRNFDSLINGEHDEGSDIDILVNDYYLFKRVAGAVGYKHKGSFRYKNKGPAFEYGGYKVAGKVLLAGKEVSVDVRSVGDNYYDPNWQRKILETKVKFNNIYIPDHENLFYSLLYHALVHKKQFSEKYSEILSKMSLNIGVKNGAGEIISKIDEEIGWKLLDMYLAKMNYNYVRPNELSIPFNARDRAGILIETDLKLAKMKIKSGQYFEARHVLYHVVRDTSFDAKGLLLLFVTEFFILTQGFRLSLLNRSSVVRTLCNFLWKRT
jgi:predicted Ser/Thr protein kinase